MRLEDPATEPFHDTIPLPDFDPVDDLPRHVPRRRPPRLLALAAAGLALAAFGAASVFVVQRRASAKTSAAVVDAAPIQTLDENGWRFTVHLPTGSEALYDLQSDPRCRTNVMREHPDRADRMRGALLRRCGVQTMEELRAPHQELTDALRRLGYL